MQKKIALLHRYPPERISETNASFPHLKEKDIDVLTFKSFDRLTKNKKFWKSVAWVFYAPLLVWGKGYKVIYCDDSFPFYPLLVKLVCPKAKVIIRLGDLHLMYHTEGVLYDFLHFFERLTWRKVDKILTISYAMEDYVHAECGRIPVTILDPVDLDVFKLRGHKHKKDMVMFHGVLTKNKNVDLLIECAWLMPDINFEVVGGGPELERLRSKSPQNVFYHGWVPFERVPELISTCTVGLALRGKNPGNEFVVTSPFIQYGAMGKPCLVTRREVFGNYPWQFTDAKDMAKKLRELLKDPYLHGYVLMDYVYQNHDASRIAEKIWSVLQ